MKWIFPVFVAIIAAGIGAYFYITANKSDDNYVDLGLSVSWAKYNVGATDETDPGKYFGVPNEEIITNPLLVRVSRSNNYGNAINTLIKTFDSSYRLPEIWEINELVNTCRWEREDNGYRVIGPNGNSIFLPFTGCYYGDKHLSESLGIYMINDFRKDNWNDELNNTLEIGNGVKIINPDNDNVAYHIEDAYLAIRPVKDYR